MPDHAHAPVVTPDDSRLAGMGQESIAGYDQIAAQLAATPDERLDSLEAAVAFIDEARAALRHAD